MQNLLWIHIMNVKQHQLNRNPLCQKMKANLKQEFNIKIPHLCKSIHL
ncbi:hypothetical protein X975_00632, partial [Stegodyphus mimosarum]